MDLSKATIGSEWVEQHGASAVVVGLHNIGGETFVTMRSDGFKPKTCLFFKTGCQSGAASASAYVIVGPKR